MIRIKYRINGALFRLSWKKAEVLAARTRIAVLRENGIEVEVRGMPDA